MTDDHDVINENGDTIRATLNGIVYEAWIPTCPMPRGEIWRPVRYTRDGRKITCVISCNKYSGAFETKEENDQTEVPFSRP